MAARTAQGRDGVQIVRRPDNAVPPIVMRVVDGSFADIRVRVSLRLAVDRDVLVAQGLSGFGHVANDILSLDPPEKWVC